MLRQVGVLTTPARRAASAGGNPPEPESLSFVAVSGGGATLSNGDTTVSGHGSSGWDTALAASRSAGKLCFEAVVGASGGQAVVGVADEMPPGEGAGSYAGKTAGSIGYVYNATVIRDGATLATYAAFTAGDVVTVAVDFAADKAWFAKNGAWNGDPAAGTGGVTALGGSACPACSVWGAADSLTLRDPVHLPSGFGAWS